MSPLDLADVLRAIEAGVVIATVVTLAIFAPLSRLASRRCEVAVSSAC